MQDADYLRIPLRNRAGEIVAHALIDAEDAHLADHRWHLQSTGYARRSGGKRGTYLYLHRELMGCTRGDGVEIDHIDGDPLNCRRLNLRRVTHAGNKQNLNVSGYRSSSSGYRGVHRHGDRWTAVVKHNGVRHYLGYFADPADAAAAAEAFRAAHGIPSFTRKVT